MSNRIKRGDIGFFHPHGNSQEEAAPMQAVVEHVWSDTCVNVKLGVDLDSPAGAVFTSVYVPGPGATMPSGYFFVLASDTEQVSVAGEVKSDRPKSEDVLVQPRITGYRQLSKREADMINEGKELAELVGKFITKLRSHPATPAAGLPQVVDPEREPFIDQRWVSIGATDLQKGFMSVIRGIAQPSTF